MYGKPLPIAIRERVKFIMLNRFIAVCSINYTFTHFHDLVVLGGDDHLECHDPDHGVQRADDGQNQTPRQPASTHNKSTMQTKHECVFVHLTVCLLSNKKMCKYS